MKSRFEKAGDEIRRQTRELILNFMKQSEECQPRAEGIKQAELFRVCGLDWGGTTYCYVNSTEFLACWVVKNIGK